MRMRSIALPLAMALAGASCTLGYPWYLAEGLDAGSDAGITDAGPVFPRLAGTNTNDPHNYDDAGFQAQLAKLEVVVIAVWVGWKSPGVLEASLQGIHARNPRTKVLLETGTQRVGSGTLTDWALKEKLQEMGWGLSPGDGGVVNITRASPPDDAGLRAAEWLAKNANQQFFEPAPSLAGISLTDIDPIAMGDWNRDGAPDNSVAAAAAVHEGVRDFITALRSAARRPDLLAFADVQKVAAGDVPADLVGVFGGGWLQGVGNDWADLDRVGGFTRLLGGYRRALQFLGEPKMLVMVQRGDLTNYQGFRYGYCTTLLDDGLYAFDQAWEGHRAGGDVVVWFDEYNFKLGHATSPPPTGPWVQPDGGVPGVWRRDFETGIVLVNPNGDGGASIRVDLERPFRRLSGTQDPVTNDGTQVTSVVLRARDGLVLQR